MQNTTIEQALVRSCQDIDNVDARLLLENVMQANHAFLLTHSEQVMTQEQITVFNNLVTQRINGMPVAYLTGECGFYDLIFNVSPAVLIPRPETELLIELALVRIPEGRPYRILDLGTGSGVIAITLAKHCPHASVMAVDLSTDAISIARMNAKNLDVDNICFVTGNWFDGLAAEKFDLIISNPPYVAENDPHLEQGDLRFEPQMALTAGVDGLACLNTIIRTAPIYLFSGGWLLFEHGYDQATACRNLLECMDFSNICAQVDLANITRVSGGQFNHCIASN